MDCNRVRLLTFIQGSADGIGKSIIIYNHGQHFVGGALVIIIGRNSESNRWIKGQPKVIGAEPGQG